jgi:uncharacterized protein
MKTLQLLQKNREKIYAIAAKHGVSNIRVFGSVARGEDTKKSDIDLLAKVADNISLMTLVKLEKSLEKEAGRKVQIISDNAVNKHLKKQIFSEMITL